MPRINKSEGNGSILKFVVKRKRENENSGENNNICDFINKKIKTITSQQPEEENKKNIENENITDSQANELKEAKEKNKKLQSDLKATIALLKNASSVNLEKDIQINKLLKTKSDNGVIGAEGSKSLFEELKGEFNSQQLLKLRSISSGKSRDSTFVLQMMRFLYPDPSALSFKSVTGKMCNKIKKEKLTPRKVALIKTMLHQRILSEKGIEEILVSQRLGRVDKLICDAITKIKPKNTGQSLNLDPCRAIYIPQTNPQNNFAQYNTPPRNPTMEPRGMHFNMNASYLHENGNGLLQWPNMQHFSTTEQQQRNHNSYGNMIVEFSLRHF